MPDWICEGLSPSNRGYERAVKLPFYARAGVEHAWVIDPAGRTIETKRLKDSGRWVDVAAFTEDQVMTAERFAGARDRRHAM